MKTLKVTVIATAIATAASFWAGEIGLLKRFWPQHPQLAGFFVCLVACLVVQLCWPDEWLASKKKT